MPMIQYPGYDLGMEPIDPFKAIEMMPTENPYVWKDPTNAGPDIAGGLGKTMKSIYAQQMMDRLMKQNEERWGKQFGLNEKALNANVEYGDPMREQNARAAMAPNYYKDPEDQGNFVLGSPHQYQAPTGEEQDLKRFWDIAMTFGYEQGGQQMPQEIADEIWNRVLKEKDFGSGYYSVQAAEKRGNAVAAGKETTAQVFAAIDDQIAKGLITPEMGATMKANHMRGAGKTETAEGKQTKVDQDYVLGNVSNNLSRAITQVSQNFNKMLEDPKNPGKPKANLTKDEEATLTAWKLRIDNLKTIITEIERLKKNRLTNGAYNISPQILAKLSDILNAKQNLYDPDLAIDQKAIGPWIQMLIAELQSEGKTLGSQIIEKQAAAGIKK